MTFCGDGRNRTRSEDHVRKWPAMRKHLINFKRDPSLLRKTDRERVGAKTQRTKVAHECVEQDRNRNICEAREDPHLSWLAGGRRGFRDRILRMGSGLLWPRNLSGRAPGAPWVVNGRYLLRY